MVKQYEMTREMFNKCAGDKRPEVFFDEVEADENGLQELIRQYLTGKDVSFEKTESPDATVFEITSDGQRQRITFSEI